MGFISLHYFKVFIHQCDMTNSKEKQELHENILAAASGDEVAWGFLVNAYSHRVFALIRSKCGNEDLAEEITQSTFCTIAQKLATYTETGKFEAWIFRIAMNRMRDEMRRRKRHAVPMENEMIGVLAPGVIDEHTDEEMAKAVQRLRTAVRQLSSSDQDIIHMRHSAGMSYKQIADVLGEPLGTVLARQHRALGKLRSLMDCDGYLQNNSNKTAIDGEMGR
ncbi:MAG TPA: sigma-70 family RNA polymerase sigma factor [Phycisphaerales bacterium]|nr:sigma-70 family RNA polymerase sigma factor [Phycisphaerales bacterium]HIB00760.1 sigma-70 family RNA polymerase sigma factor [Phycisphaerales bacterium]HIO20711.1 sigma-70 family RNA polymerase sigma factor [Phycisphaerales bacterium]HIO52544.1 sigma-70 family RNA polymerase sigma factor [Phycisphaerales bacterium]